MNEKEMKDLIARMEAGQDEVYESITARKGKEYAEVIMRSASCVSVLKMACSMLENHPQMAIIEKAVRYGTYCVMQMAVAECMRTQGKRAVDLSADEVVKMAKEIDGDVGSLLQQIVKKVKLPKTESE